MKTIVKLTLAIFIGVCLLTGIGHLVLQHSSVKDSMQVVSPYFMGFLALRYTLYVLCVVFWPKIIFFIGVARKWHPEFTGYLAQQRVKVLVFFILIEVLFVFNILGHLFAWL